MPRLINADAYLDKVCTYKTTGCGSCEFLLVCPDDEQTVKAIPVEWIINWLTKQTIPAQRTCDDYSGVEKMLDDWEKENEQNKKNSSQTD